MTSVLNEVLSTIGFGQDGLLRPWWDMLGLRIATLMGIATTLVLALDAVSDPPSCLPYQTFQNDETLYLDINATFMFVTAHYVERYCKDQQNIYNLYFGWVLLSYTLLVITIQEIWYLVPIQKSKLDKFSQIISAAKTLPMTKNEMLQVLTSGHPDHEDETLSNFYSFYRELSAFLKKMGNTRLLVRWYVLKLVFQIIVVVTAFVLNFPGLIFKFQPEYFCDFSKKSSQKRVLHSGTKYECINDLTYFNRHVLNLFELLLLAYIILSFYGAIKSIRVMCRYNKPTTVLADAESNGEIDGVKGTDIEMEYHSHKSENQPESEPLETVRKRRKSTKTNCCKLEVDTREYDPEMMKNDAAFLVCLFGLSNEHDSVKLTDILSLSFTEKVQNVVFSPKNLKPVYPIQLTQLVLQWQPPSAGHFTGFLVECDPPTTVSDIIDQSIPNSLVRSAMVSGCTPGTTYKVSVRSKLNSKQSQPETIYVVTRPDKPTFEAKNVETHAVDFNCKHPRGSFTHYQMIATRTSDKEVVASFIEKYDINEDEEIIRCKKLQPNTEYTFRLRVMLNFENACHLPVNVSNTKCIESKYEQLVITTAS